MNRRRIITKYQLGNLIFLGAAFFFGIVFSTYISQIFKIYYVWYAGIEKWAFFVGGMQVMFFGLSILAAIFLARKILFDTVFIYMTTISLFLAYWSLFFINSSPKNGMFLFFVVPVIIGFMIALMSYIWKRNGGVVVWVAFACGFIFSAAVRVVLPVDIVSTLKIIRFSFLSIALVLFAYLFGFIGMFKGRKTYLAAALAFMFLSILYPLNLRTVISKKCVSQSKELSSLACVNKYETGKRLVDVWFGKYTGNADSFLFVENNRIDHFTYPMDDTSKLFLYSLLLQHPNPKNLLLAGDVPLGALEIYKAVYSLQSVTVYTFDLRDALAKERLANPTLFSNVHIVDSFEEIEKGAFDEIIVFLPAFNTINIASLINKTLLNEAKDAVIAYTGTSNNYDVLNTSIKQWLTNSFKKVEVLQYGPLMSVMASNNESFVTISPDVLKMRYLDMKISFDYTKARGFIETIKPFSDGNKRPASRLTMASIGLINDYIFPGTYKGARCFAYIAVFFILIYALKYFLFIKTGKYSLFYYSDLAFTSMLSSSLLVIAILYYQLNWGEIYSRIPVAIGLYVVGVVFAALIYYYLAIEKYYAYYMIVAAAIVLQVNFSWMVLMRKIEFSPYVWLYMLLFGLSVVFSLSNIIVKNKMTMDVTKVLYMTGLMAVGIGTGIVLAILVFIPLVGLDYSSYLLFLCSLVSLVFHAFIVGKTQENKV